MRLVLLSMFLVGWCSAVELENFTMSTNRPETTFTAARGGQAFVINPAYCHSGLFILSVRGEYNIEWSTNATFWFPTSMTNVVHGQSVSVIMPMPTNYPNAFLRARVLK